MITKVLLKNWRSHTESDFVFGAGTNALLGISGSGKSSVLDAVCFALFGTFPILQTKKLKLEDLIMRKPVEKNNAEVEVSFRVNGTEYSVKRTIERGRGTTYSEIRENGKIIESPSTSRVTELVEKVLKVNYDLFSKAIYSEQNSLDYFLTIPKGARMRKIDELLLIDKFEKSRAGVVSLINRMTERRLGKQSMIENVDLEELQRTVQGLKDSLNKDWMEKTSMERKLSQTTVTRENLENQYMEMKKSLQNLETLKREEKGMSGVIQEIYLSLSSLENSLKGVDKESVEKSLNDLLQYSSELERMLKEKSSQYERRSSQTAKSKGEMESFKKQTLERLESQLKEKLEIAKNLEGKETDEKKLEKNLDEKKKSIEKLVGEIEVFGSKIKDLEEIIAQINSTGGKCPVCDTKFTKEMKTILIKQKFFQIDKMKEKVAEAQEKKSINEKEVRALEDNIRSLSMMLDAVKDMDKVRSEYENAQHVYHVLNESSTKLEEEILSLRSDIEKLQTELKDSMEKRQKLEFFVMKSIEYREKDSRLKYLVGERNKIVSQISALESSISNDGIASIETELRRLVAEEREYATRLVTLDPVIREKEARLNDLEQTMLNVAKEKDEARKLEETIRQLKIFEKALEQTQLELRKEFVTSVNFAMNELWSNLYPYRDFVGLRLAVDENDYILQLQETSGKWVNVEGFASGGERSIAALTLRIAFALVLAPQLKWLVLDEPTHNLDTKAVEDLAVTLAERIGNFVDQVFLITHDEKLENAVVGSLYRLERDKSKDGSTRAILVS